jgi:hypothetical protein
MEKQIHTVFVIKRSFIVGWLTERNGWLYEEEMCVYTIEGREWLRDRDGRVNERYLEERSVGEDR